MRYRPLKLCLVAVAAAGAVLPIVATSPAFADYAPAKGDVVGVGSDTLQYLLDFMADGDAYGSAGFNNGGNKNKVISFDATADANARLAYGDFGGTNTASSAPCAGGTGGTVGTGNTAGSYTGGAPCVLNPTIQLRAGTQPVQRPNGSGAGLAALQADVNAGHNSATGTNFERINFARSSSANSVATLHATTPTLDQLEVATDTLPILKSTSSHAVPLSGTELNNIYNATTTTTNAYGGTGCVKWNQLPGNSAGSADFIIPIIPQVGSGTRKFFLQQIQNTTGTPANPGNCSVVGEENDPTAVPSQAGATEPMGETGTANDAIEPMSAGRLNVFQGNTYSFDGTNWNLGAGGLSSVGYFLDPSCPYLTLTAACGTGTGNATPIAVNPAVSLIQTGTPGDSNPLFDPNRPLYVLFRSTDVTSTSPIEPGFTENWVNYLFYNPCPLGGSGCSTDPGGFQVGPGGDPYIDASGAQDLADAGVVPFNTMSPSALTS